MLKNDWKMTRRHLIDECGVEASRLPQAWEPWIDLTGHDFDGASLQGALLRNCDLSRCTFQGADLTRASLDSALLENAALGGANLAGASLNGAKLVGTIAHDADFKNAVLTAVNIKFSYFLRADFRGAILAGARLRRVGLTGAIFDDHTRLDDVRMSNVDLSGATGLPTASRFMSEFKRDSLGFIVYKAIGNTYFPVPERWHGSIKPGGFITEAVNSERGEDCGCGVNFATLRWIVDEFYLGDPHITVWKCRIRYEDAADIVVPYNSGGKARCHRLELIEPLTPSQVGGILRWDN